MNRGLCFGTQKSKSNSENLAYRLSRSMVLYSGSQKILLNRMERHTECLHPSIEKAV